MASGFAISGEAVESQRETLNISEQCESMEWNGVSCSIIQEHGNSIDSSLEVSGGIVWKYLECRGTAKHANKQARVGEGSGVISQYLKIPVSAKKGTAHGYHKN